MERITIVFPGDIYLEGKMKFILSLIITMTFSSIAFGGFVKTTAPDQYDILFVIDDSGSMAQHQANLASSLPTLLAEFKSESIQLGVTTSSALVNQGIIEGTELMGPSVAGDFETVVKATSQTIGSIGTQGSATEIFLPTIFAVLTSPANQGFLRADSKLVVVIMTDEGDYSDSSVSDTLRDLMELKGFFDIKVHGILGTDAKTGCFNGQTASMLKIQTLVSATGGTSLDLCASDWSSFVIPK